MLWRLEDQALAKQLWRAFFDLMDHYKLSHFARLSKLADLQNLHSLKRNFGIRRGKIHNCTPFKRLISSYFIFCLGGEGLSKVSPQREQSRSSGTFRMATKITPHPLSHCVLKSIIARLCKSKINS